MKLNNTRQIRAEDFEDDYTQLTSQLGTILNPFMQEVVELSEYGNYTIFHGDLSTSDNRKAALFLIDTFKDILDVDLNFFKK